MSSDPIVDIPADAVYALAGEGRLVYAARSSGLYRSTDGGATWANAFASLSAQEIPAAISAAYAGGTIFAGVKGAALRSEDDGATWHAASLGSPAPLPVALAVSPTFEQDGCILAGTQQDGVFVSTDRGGSWTPWNFGLIDLNVNALSLSPDFSRDRTVYAATESGVFISTNGGRGWRETAFPMDAAPVLCLAVTSDQKLFAGTEEGVIYITKDRGDSWQPSHTSTAAIQTIRASTSSRLWALTEDSLLQSPDGGQTWTALTFDLATQSSALAALEVEEDQLMVGYLHGEIQHLKW